MPAEKTYDVTFDLGIGQGKNNLSPASPLYPTFNKKAKNRTIFTVLQAGK